MSTFYWLGFLYKEKKYTIIAIFVVLFLLIIGIVIILTNRKKPTLPINQNVSSCSRLNCLSGCCTGTICQPKDASIAQFTCIGANKWKGSDGATVIGAPKQVIETVTITNPDAFNSTQNVSTPRSSSVVTVSPVQSLTPTMTPYVLKPDDINSLDYLPIALKVNAWLEKNKTATGVYKDVIDCQPGGVCTPGMDDPHAGIGVIWGRYKLYTKTKDPNVLFQFTQDLIPYTDPNKVEDVQVNFWHCVLLNDLVTDANLTPDVKSMAQKACDVGSYFNDPQWSQIDTSTKNDQIEEPDLGALMANTPVDPIFPSTEQKFNDYAYFSSEYAMRYIQHKDPIDLKKSKIYFTRAASIYSNGKANNASRDRTLIGVAALELFEATGEDAYLNFAKKVAGEKQKEGCQYLRDCERYAYLSQRLFKHTNDANYRETFENIAMKMIGDLFDFQGYKGYQNNYGSFQNQSDQNVYSYPIRDNGFILGLLAGYTP